MSAAHPWCGSDMRDPHKGQASVVARVFQRRSAVKDRVWIPISAVYLLDRCSQTVVGLRDALFSGTYLVVFKKKKAFFFLKLIFIFMDSLQDDRE